MDPSNFRRNKKFVSRKPILYKKIRNERDDEEWNDVSSQEDIDFENEVPLESIPEPEYDEDEVFLSWYDSDLNLIIDDNFTAASPLHQRGFSFLQAGARATFGFFSGKVCFEVKVLQCCKLSRNEGHLNTHLLRVGWSPRKASLALGSDHKSYGYDSAGRISTIGEIVDYGKIFSTGDVVGAYMDIGEDKVSLSFTVNGEDMGVAYEIPQTVVQKEPLFPHILTKNISYECNFGKEKPWFPPKEGYTFVANVEKVHRIAGPRRPKSQSECEVILMVGLPKSGKTSWVNEFREKNPGMYYVIDSNALIDRMELMDPEREAIILRKTRVLGRLLGIAMDRRRNYILDQINIVRAEQVWKLGFFRNHKRRIVSVVIPDEELKKRTKKFDGEDSAWMLKLKAKFRLPTMSCPQISQVANKVEYVGLPLREALQLVKSYNREAWRRGYKPYKNFRIPPQVFNEKNPMTKGDWMPQGMADPRDADFRGSGDWGSPPRARGSDEWLPPPRNRSTEEWQSPLRKRNSGEWHSPSRQRMSGDWPPPPRSRSPGLWPPPESNKPGGVLRSLSKGRMDDSWSPGSRKRRYSESPPRNRPRSRWGPPVEEQPPPLNRAEEWQSRRARSPGPRNSPPRRRPDVGTRYSGRHSPPGSRTEELHTGRGRFHAEDTGGWETNEGGRPMQGNPGHENWIGTGQERLGKFPLQEVRDRSVAFPQDMQLEGNFPPEQRGDDGMLRCESRVSGSLPPQEAGLAGRFPHRGSIMGHSLSPPRCVSNEFPLEEARFSSNLVPKKERVENSLHSRKVRIDSDFSSRDQRMGGTFPRKEGGFPPQDSQFGPDHVPFEERANMSPLEGRMGRGFSPRGRKGNIFPPPERRMIGSLSVRDRLGAKLDDMPPRESRPTRSLSPHERMMGDMLPNEVKMHHDVTLHESRMGDFQPRGGRIDEMSPHLGSMRDDRTAPIGRTGGNLLFHGNRMGDPHGGRVISNLPPQEHRIGDLPPHEGRMGGDFAPRAGRPGDNLPPRGSRRGGDFAHQEDVTGYPFPLQDRLAADVPSHEGRMSGDLLSHGRMGGDFPFHEGRVGHDNSQRGREIGDMPRGKRMSGDMPIGGEVGDDIPIRRGRMIGDIPPREDRIGSDLPRGGNAGEFTSNSGRIDTDVPFGGRVGDGDFFPHGGNISGDLPPRERIGNDHLSHRERIGGDMPPRGGRRGGDSPPFEGRLGGEMPPPGGKPRGNMPFFGERHDEFPSRGGRPGGDIPHHGRPGSDLPPDGRRYGGDFPSHGGRFDADMPPHEGKLSGDLPPHGGRIGGDVQLYGGRIDSGMSQEVGMLGDPREGSNSSSDRWNRLPSNSDDPRNFEWMGDQELGPNKENMKSRPGHSGQPLPPDRCEGGGPSGDWKPLDDCLPDRASLPRQQLQHQLDNRNLENNANRFHDNKRVSPSHVPHKWPSPSRARRPGSPSPSRPGRRSSSPLGRSRIDQHTSRPNIEQPGGRHASPRRPMAGRQSPIGRNDGRSPEGRHGSHHQSPVRDSAGGWRPPGGRHSGDWQPLGRGNHGGQSDRLPPNVDRGRLSPPRKQQRMEINLGDRSSRPFTEGPDGRDSHGPGFPPIGNVDIKIEPTGRDLRDRILSGNEQHGTPFNPSSQSDALGPSGSGGQFRGKEEPVNEPGAGRWQNAPGAPREGWQSSGGGSGGGSRWERVPEEEEELAPYEIPFNQADWDSNDPCAGIYYSASGYRPQLSGPDPSDERSRGSRGGRNQEVGRHSGSKSRGSVWQRVGGYVDDEKESNLREQRGPSCSADHSSSRGRGERGRRGVERDDKERDRVFDERRMRRGRDK